MLFNNPCKAMKRIIFAAALGLPLTGCDASISSLYTLKWSVQ